MLNRQQTGTLLIAGLVFILVRIPIYGGTFLFSEDGVSTNDTQLFIIFPCIATFFLFSLPLLAVKFFPALSDFELVWKTKPRAKIHWYVLLVFFTFAAQISIGTIAWKAGLPRSTVTLYHDVTQLTLAFFILSAAQIVILGPIAEEFFWRGFMQDQFAKCFGAKIALLLQAFLFALYHRYYFMGFLQIFLVGLVFGFWRLKRRSLIPIIIMHIIINGLITLAQMPYQYEMSKVNIAVNYVGKINQLGKSASETENADADYQKALTLFHQPPKKLNDDKLVRPSGRFDELTDEQQQALEDWIAQNSAALTHFRAGTLKPVYWPAAQGNVMQDADDFKESYQYQLMELACVCCWNAKIAASQGDTEQALDDLLCCLRHCRHLLSGPKSEGTFMNGSAILRCTCYNAGWILSGNDITAEQLESFQKNIQQVFEDYPSTLDFTWEQFTLYDIIQRTFTDDGNGDGHLPKLEAQSMDTDMVKLMAGDASDEEMANWKYSTRKETTVIVDEYFKLAEREFSQPHYKQRQDNSESTGDLAEKIRDNVIRIYLPQLKSTYQIYHETKAAGDALIATLAVMRYQKATGTLPDSLETLTAEGLLDTLPIDPYSGQTLIYKKEDSGFRLYSIGQDFEDNGGLRNPNPDKRDKDIIFWPPPQ